MFNSTLVIPTYNRAELVCETIDSALWQSRRFAEIIVIDDGSTDNTIEIIRSRYPSVRMVQNRKWGVQAARNLGVSLSNTPFVTFCDSDDMLLPPYLETMARGIEAMPELDAFYSNFQIIGAGSEGVSKLDMAPSGWFEGANSTAGFWHDIPDLYLRTVKYQPLWPSGLTIRKSFYHAIGGYSVVFNGVPSEDWEMTLRVAGFGKVALQKNPVVLVRRHDMNESRDNMRQVRGSAEVLEYALRYHAIPDKYKPEIAASIARRWTDVFNAHFAGGDFAQAHKVWSRLSGHPKDVKVILKRAISLLPAPLRSRAWSMAVKPAPQRDVPVCPLQARDVMTE